MLPRTPAPRPVEVVRAGTVQNGEYLDADWPIRMRVPEGWTATPGARDEPLRLSLREPRTQVGLELRIYADGPVGPRSREGCAWTFETEGHFRAVRVADPVVVATCTPDEPLAPRVLGYYFKRGEAVYALESVLPVGHLIDGKSMADDAVGGVRFLLGEPAAVAP